MNYKNKTKSNKKRVARILVDNKDIIKTETSLLKNGKRSINIEVNAACYQMGYLNENGKYKVDYQSPNFLMKNWLEDLQYDGHFCFVDTNRISPPYSHRSDLVQATGWYIFQMATLDIEKGQEETIISWNADYINSKIGLVLHPENIGCPEKKGWEFAINEMQAMGVVKVKIFVDKHQNDLSILSRELPQDWDYYYVSSDRSSVWFNHIFRRLDSAINILFQNGPNNYKKLDIENYLMCNVDHLIQ